jgi:AraC-like DNA-binding protein
MPLIGYLPSPPLTNYIDVLYYLYGPMPYPREEIIPAPWLDLKINLGSAFAVYKRDHAEPFVQCEESWAVGLWNEYHIIEWPSDTRIFGVSFKPGGAYPLFRMPISELHNRVVPLDSIWGTCVAEIRERLNTAPTVQAGFVILEAWLSRLLQEETLTLKPVQYALGQMGRSHGALSIRALSDHIGISQNHLNTQFKRFLGGTPKEYARLFRFQRVVNDVDLIQSNFDWTQVAHQALYYDQSHFNKDFKAFTGQTPSTYLQIRRQVNANHPEHAQFLRELPLD